MFHSSMRGRAAAILSAGLLMFSACGGTPPDTGLGNSGGGGDLGASAPDSGDNFSLDLALELARLDLQAYQMLNDFENGQTFTLPAPYTLVQTYLTSEPFAGESADDGVPIAFVATQDQNIYVVFRGTKTIVEWLDDAQFGQVPYSFLSSGGLTEQGFTSVYATIHSEIVQTVKQLAQSGDFTTLYVTGHSLGAALAVLAAPELAKTTPFASPVMYSFAGPRVGNPKFGLNTYDPNVATSWRVVNTNDLVPKLPNQVTVVFEGGTYKTYFYQHVETELDITFGNPVSGPTDITDIEFNHSLCNYYNTLCAETADPQACEQQAGEADGCNT
ncbi:MAG: lipase family protein [Deltaproteobacteria bacterium]|nr:lipase family protein [Deltaproteobacteria bacterium]